MPKYTRGSRKVDRGSKEANMFCPQCKSEYKEGYTLCAECNVSLVSDLEERPEPASSLELGSGDLVSVLTTLDTAFVSDVVILLEEQGIPYMLQSGTAFGVADGLVGTAGPLTWQAILWIPSAFRDPAESILKQVRERFLQSKKENDSEVE